MKPLTISIKAKSQKGRAYTMPHDCIVRVGNEVIPHSQISKLNISIECDEVVSATLELLPTSVEIDGAWIDEVVALNEPAKKPWYVRLREKLIKRVLDLLEPVDK